MPLGRLDATPGTRLLVTPTGLIGHVGEFLGHQWEVLNEFCPIRGSRKLSRLRVVDQYGFVSFINEMDFHLIEGSMRPGQFHPWSMQMYPEIGDYKDGWEGLHLEEEDLEDDLHYRELEWRASIHWGMLPPYQQLTRYMHSDGVGYRMLEMFLQDIDPETREGPDFRIETLSKRWAQVEKEKVDCRV